MSQNHDSVTINFSDFGGPVYIGRPKGEKARARFQLDLLDETDQTVFIKIPEGTYSINSSFFLGFFGKSIRSAGSRESFLKKYQFSAPESLNEAIESFITRALHEKKPMI